MMRQWEIWKYPFGEEIGDHWVVILSNDERCGKDRITHVNGLICTTLRPAGRELSASEVVLNGTEGFDRKTVVRCDVIYLIAKAQMFDKIGAVASTVRRKQMARAMAAGFRLPNPWS